MKSILDLICGLSLMPFLYLLPRDNKKAVFGAWKGLQCSDNPKYFMIYLVGHSDIRCYWVGEECVREQVEAIKGARFVKKGSFAALWHFLTAGYVCCNVAFHEDIANVQICGNVKRINLWHGIPFKNIGNSQLDGKGGTNEKKRGRFLTVLSKINIWLRQYAFPLEAYTSASSDKMKAVMCESMSAVFSSDRVAVCGTPRNDFLINNANNAELRLKLRQRFEARFGIKKYKRWYLYMPTWRHGMSQDYSFTTSAIKSEFTDLLRSQDAVLIEKQHPKILAAMHTSAQRDDNIVSLSEEESKGLDVQELLLASDCLITDYSACFYDFETMHRPVIHFAYDYKEYVEKDTGAVYDLSDVAAGPVAHNENELIAAMRLTDAEMLLRKGPRANEPIIAETGRASESIAKWLKML